jgi:hypothetical protein
MRAITSICAEARPSLPSIVTGGRTHSGAVEHYDALIYGDRVAAELRN